MIKNFLSTVICYLLFVILFSLFIHNYAFSRGQNSAQKSKTDKDPSSSKKKMGNQATVQQKTSKKVTTKPVEKKVRKKFPFDDFFPEGVDQINKIFLPEPVEYIDPKDLKSDKKFIEKDKGVFAFATREITLPGFIGEQEIEGECRFIGGVKGEELYFMKEGAVCRVITELNIETQYSVIRKVTNDLFKQTFLYYYIATVTLDRLMGNRKYAKLKILQSRMEIEEGDIIVPYVSFDRTVDISDRGLASLEDPGSIIGFSSKERTISGSGELVFVNRGMDDDMTSGKIYAIHRTNRWEKVFASATKYVVDDLFLVGKLLIVDVSNVGAVGYILEANSEVYIDDRVGEDWGDVY